MTTDDERAIKEFNEAVNMSAKEMENWLATEESKSVGSKETESSESVGHKSGKKIIDILNKNKNDYTKDDLAHIHKVVGYIHRHSAQRPNGDITDTNWRYSLMNWGYDPKKHGGK